MRVFRSILMSGACAAVVLGLSGTAAAVPAVASPLAASGTDVDDFSHNAAYAGMYSQKIAWDAKSCPRGGAWPPDASSQLKRVSPRVAAQLRSLQPAVQPPTLPPMECATIVAPKDWLDVSKGTLKVGIARPVQAPDAARPARLLLSNPGGPGGSGLMFGLTAEKMMKTHGTHLSVGIDPRGVGLSSTVTCEMIPVGPPSGEITVEKLAEMMMKSQAQMLKKCQTEQDTLLPYIDTVNTARDFNLVRHLLGYERSDYFGVSYGTWLGSVMAKMFPQKFDRVVLDSNTDWRTGTLTNALTKHFPRGFQASLERVVYPWLARHDSTYGLGTTGDQVKKSLDELEKQAIERGVQGAMLIAKSAVMTMLGSRQPQEYLPETGKAVLELKDFVNTTPSEPQPEPSNPNSPQPDPSQPPMPQPTVRANVTQQAVNCNDSGSSGSLRDSVALAQHNLTKYPLVGITSASFMCVDWPRAATLTKDIINRPLHNVLMLQDENDAPTPYQGAFLTRMQETSGVRMVLVDDGHGHVASRYACAANAGSDYLTKGVFPAGDVHCQAGPLPDEKAVYEFGFAASASRPLSQVFLHQPGTIVDPEMDDAATAAQPRSGNPATDAARRFAVEQAQHDVADLASWATAWVNHR